MTDLHDPSAASKGNAGEPAPRARRAYAAPVLRRLFDLGTGTSGKPQDLLLKGPRITAT